MTWFEILVTYVIAWWLVIFMVLPFGVRQVENPEPGHDRGAPARAHMPMKFLITTILAVVITAGIYYAIDLRIVDFHPSPGEIPAASSAAQPGSE